MGRYAPEPETLCDGVSWYVTRSASGRRQSRARRRQVGPTRQATPLRTQSASSTRSLVLFAYVAIPKSVCLLEFGQHFHLLPTNRHHGDQTNVCPYHLWLPPLFHRISKVCRSCLVWANVHGTRTWSSEATTTTMFSDRSVLLPLVKLDPHSEKTDTHTHT